MYTSRAYNENYYVSRKKILQDFLRDEENETMRYIEDVESLVSSTKAVLKGIVTGELDFAQLKDRLIEIESDINNDCASLEQDISTLSTTDKNIEMTTIDLQKQEEKGTENYLATIEQLKGELELKEFKIQNMERLYVELENIIKENIQKGNEQLLSLEQFADFVAQNDKLQEECEILEEEKKQCLQDYNNLLRENLNLRSKDESFELEKIKDALEEISTMGTIHKEAEARISKLQERFKQLNNECNGLTSQIKLITKTLESLNIDNTRLNKELAIINKELYPSDKRMNRSFTESMPHEDENVSPSGKTELNYQDLNKIKKKNRHTKTTMI